MKKNINIYIVGILALLLLGVNMITLKKYRYKRQNDLRSYHKSI